MENKRHLLVLDPTAFSGGSKIATENIIRLLDSDKVRVTVLTAHLGSWSYQKLTKVQLLQPKWLSRKETGIPYFLGHIVIALNILLTRLRYGRIDKVIGASGPGVDLALYLIQPVLGFQITQLIHGPVALSKTIARCLNKAHVSYHLESSKNSILAALSRLTNKTQKTLPSHFHVMHNGLPKHSWPTRCQTNKPVIFWAASLLKWKGLDVLLSALKKAPSTVSIETHICYIQPKNTTLPVSKLSLKSNDVHYHENPHHLDKLRADANIFVSTSQNEPFGLSILEAMAAGHCVLIPDDGAYWDNTLKSGVNCIKYTANDADNLMEKLLMLNDDIKTVIRIGNAAAKMALNYQAEKLYENIKLVLESDSDEVTSNPLIQTSMQTNSRLHHDV